MSDFTVHFQYPWLLLLLVPAIALTLIPYFRSAKKYRRNRNRIVSLVLHGIVMTLAIFVLSGMTFSYRSSDIENEVLLLVDMSDSGREAEAERERFIRDALDDSNGDCSIGIVTFGKNAVYAAPLTADPDEAYGNYVAAALPDGSASDIASALDYAKTLFDHPETAKIVVISDGAETDKSALSAIRTVTADGIRVDTVYIAPEARGDEAQLVDIVLPDYNVTAETPFSVGVTVQSSYVGDAVITVYDNGDPGNSREVKLNAGLQTFNVEHTVYTPGLHEIAFTVASEGDTLTENNRYCTYLFIETFDRILIIERADESQRLSGTFGNDYNIDVVNVADEQAMPQSLDELRRYDQVILNNIANKDLPEGFDAILHIYVNSYGGGLLTVGGNKTVNGETVANAYNREDMYGTLYQQMLPVQAVDYKPPLGVMIVIDKSQSMAQGGGLGNTGKNFLELAKDGAISCLRLLDERDYCGVISLSASYDEDIVITPMTEMSKIIAAISEIKLDSSTVFTDALVRAGQALRALSDVERKHIILVTDGAPGDDRADYERAITENFKSGITTSVINIGSTDNPDMQYAAEELGGGRFHGITNLDTIASEMRDELSAPDIKEINYGPFTPMIKDHTSVTNGISQESMPQLRGYYGTKVKDGAEVPLTGEYVPIYAQWKYGAGTVGSFMCDLNGVWSAEFLASETGVKFLENVIKGLFPTENIRPRDIDVEFTDDNFTKQLNVFTALGENEVLEVQVADPDVDFGAADGNIQVLRTSAAEGYNRMTFTVERSGVYKVLVQRKDAEDNVISEYLTYKAFSYSEEYDVFADVEKNRELMERMAGNGDGLVIEESAEIFENFITSIERVIDPSLAFIAIAIVLFLLDIAVRKFKFKWIHEIVRERSEKKAQELGAAEKRTAIEK